MIERRDLQLFAVVQQRRQTARYLAGPVATAQQLRSQSWASRIHRQVKNLYEEYGIGMQAHTIVVGHELPLEHRRRKYLTES